MTEPSHAVFLSYASQDAQAARNVCEALRAAGIEVWFDQSELRGGDAWDQSIRKQIKTCALFIPLISRHTHERREGYFRLEWKLAVDRSNLISSTQAFLVPVVIDDTREDDEEVPERMREIHWTRLPGGETSPAFVKLVQRLLSGEALAPIRAASGAVPVIGGRSPPSSRSRRALPVAAAVVILATVSYLAIERPWSLTAGTPAVFSPPPHSIAVLPFVNMSGDKDQEYFSEGLSEELLNSLAEINELQVAARTSSFSFKDKEVDVATIAHKLNVAAVLEGSVRRSGHTIRITTQLINSVTGFRLWSKSYDRDLGDVLTLQTEIATAVAGALKVTLLGDEAAKIELGGTRNAAAFDAYLRGLKAFQSRHEDKEIPAAVEAYSEAIRLDPGFALAFASRAYAVVGYVTMETTGTAMSQGVEKAEADARRAIALAPDLAEAHVALANVMEVGHLDFARANESYLRALALAPGNAQVLRESGVFAILMGHTDTGIAALRRAVVLDPLAGHSHYRLGHALYFTRRYEESTRVLSEAIKLNPGYERAYAFRGLALYGLGDLKSANAACEEKRDDIASQWCLAVLYDKLGRRAEAERELSKLKAALGDVMAYQYATIYAQWGDRATALDWLETAMRLHDGGLETLKMDPFMDPLRSEPRFRAIEQQLRFPD